MNIETTQYVFSHGKAPRGTGTWAFDLLRQGKWSTVFAPGMMSLTEAKRWVLQEARSLSDVTAIQVAP